MVGMGTGVKGNMEFPGGTEVERAGVVIAVAQVAAVALGLIPRDFHTPLVKPKQTNKYRVAQRRSSHDGVVLHLDCTGGYTNLHL